MSTRIENQIEAPWCSWPHRENQRDPGDFKKTCARCDAWREFLKSETIEKFKKIKGNAIWFNRYEYFDKLICEFDCSETKLRATIESLMRHDHRVSVVFVRNDIYDARAWAYLPLSCFSELSGCKNRGEKRIWQSDILTRNEIPVVQFGIKLPWTVKRACFTLAHRLKADGRIAIMTFKHPQLDRRFNGKRWAAERMFPRDTTRAEMTKALFVEIENECAKHLVTISG